MKQIHKIEQSVVSKNFLFLLVSSTVSALGDYIYDIGMVVYLYEKTKSPLTIAGFFLLQFLPSLICTPFAGTLIDRCNKKMIIVVINILRGISLLLLTFNVGIWAIFITGTILGMVEEIARSTYNSIIPLLVSDDELIKGNSLFSVSDSTTMIVGPMIATFIVVQSGINGIIIVNAISFLLSAILFSQMNINVKYEKAKSISFVKDVRLGVYEITHNSLVKHIIIIWGLLLMAIGFTNSLMIVLISSYMKLPSSTYGTMTAAEGIGIVIGSMVVLKRNKVKKENLIRYGLLAISIGTLMIALTSEKWILLFAAIIIGTGAASAPVGLRSLIQTKVHKDMIGRVFLSIRFIVTSLRSVAIIVSAVVTSFVNLRYMYIMAAGLLLCGSLLCKSLENHGQCNTVNSRTVDLQIEHES